MKLNSKTTLLLVFVVFAVVSTYRALHFYLTGFFVPDEYAYGYFHLGDIDYQSRQFFNTVNAVIFWLFNVKGPDSIVLLMPFYFMFWMTIGVLSAYKTMKLLGHDGQTISKTLLLSLSLPVFLLFGVTILTEPVSFAVVMLGIYVTVWFSKSNSKWRYLVPTFSALLFSGAALTHGDFILFQLLGWVPFVVYESKRNRNLLPILLVAALFIIPAVFFLYYPYPSGPGAVHAGQEAINNAGLPNPSPSGIPGQAGGPDVNGPPAVNGQTFVSHVRQYGFSVLNAFKIFAEGLIIGWNPVITVIIGLGFSYVIYKRQYFVLWLGFLSLGVWAGTAFIYSSAPITFSTLIRYSYDALPAFFVLVPPVLKKLNGKKALALILVGLTASGAAGAVYYQPYLQSNLGGNYPFLNGSQSFLTLDYRVPYAQVRDYFHSLSSQHFIVLAETKSLALNVTTNWRFTPGVSDINVTFYPYNTTEHFSHFYIYLEPGWQSLPDNRTISAMLDYGDYITIFETQSFFLGEVGASV